MCAFRAGMMKNIFPVVSSDFHFNFLLQEKRVGSKKDVENLVYTFTGCQFDILEPFEDLTTDQFRQIMGDIPQLCRNKYKCIMLFILSHGIKGKDFIFFIK